MRIEITYKPGLADGRAKRTAHRLAKVNQLPVDHVRIVDVYCLDGISGLEPDQLQGIFCEEVSQDILVNRSFAREERAIQDGGEQSQGWDLAVEIAYKPGVTDPVAITVREALELELGETLPGDAVIQTARQFLITYNPNVEAAKKETLPQDISRALYNPLIQQAGVIPREAFFVGEGFPELYPLVHTGEVEPVQMYDVATMTDQELLVLSKERLLALTLDEMQVIRDYYRDPRVQESRQTSGLSVLASDIELEMLGQTWSEHCKHKIFAAAIEYHDGAEVTMITRGVFKEFIKATTDELMKLRPDLRSVFHDNSGVMDFDDDYVVCIKAETHNSPSALDPYGGAITGIVGVNRDILGTGIGAWPFFNTNVLCFGHPDTPHEDVPSTLLHPKTVMAGVHEGIVDGGNQSGIPVAGGAFLFDESYLGKPLVFCGTGGLMPRIINGRNSWEKRIEPGDLAVMIGGRVGKDGIHGATFSSLALDETSPTSAVQIGDPITQRKVIDFLMEARDRDLFKGLTDNGAGGLSSSFGEMAEYSGGIRINLEQVLLKYPGLAPWEIWVSESQERMSLAVDPAKREEFFDLARRRSVEACAIGEFTDSGKIELYYQDQPAGVLDMEFVHNGLPQMRLKARWVDSSQRRPLSVQVAEAIREVITNRGGNDEMLIHQDLLNLLAEPNIRSKESLVRQYDHEVQGRSVVKPFVGEAGDGPSDGGVLQVREGSYRGVSVTHGICPRVGDDDTYAMAQLGVDEAYRAHIALGGDPLGASALDNFCWPDPVLSDATPDGEYKLAQLVRANQGLQEICRAYTLPLISGKDSMKNDVVLAGKKVSVRPTLLVTLMGIVPDVRRSGTSDFKDPGDRIYLIAGGDSSREDTPDNRISDVAMGGSYYEKLIQQRYKGGYLDSAADYSRDSRVHLGAAPRVDVSRAPAFYTQVHGLLSRGMIKSIHDLSDGGLGVALAECCIGGRLGAGVSLSSIEGLHENLAESRYLQQAFALFNEEPSRFIISVSPEKETEVQSALDGYHVMKLGTVESPEFGLEIRWDGEPGNRWSMDELLMAWNTGWEE